jgi:hypothetical protein
MAFPMLLVFGQNLSFLFFLTLFFLMPDKSVFFKVNHWIQILVFLFMFGAIISVADVNAPLYNAQTRAFVVLPNYIYWSIMLVFMINLRNFIKINTIVKYIFNGLVLSVVYNLISPYITIIPGFMNSFTPNNYAFLCIAFTSPAATYLLYKKGYGYAMLLVVIVLLTLLISERRAGIVIVFISSMLSIHLKKINIKQLFNAVILTFFCFLLSQLEPFEDAIYTTSPRIHQLLYDNDDISTTDRSLLTRKLMVEKTLIIFSMHPLTGIGLNNFSAYDVEFTGNFEGSEFVINKIKVK